MRILPDTRVFLWHLTDDPRLPESFEAAILDPANEVFLSVASVWEAVVKYYSGKLPLPGPPDIFLPQQREWAIARNGRPSRNRLLRANSSTGWVNHVSKVCSADVVTVRLTK